MRLSDVMSAMGLSSYAEVALVIFMVVFLAIVVVVFSKRHHEKWNAARYMPLDDHTPQTPREPDDGPQENRR